MHPLGCSVSELSSSCYFSVVLQHPVALRNMETGSDIHGTINETGLVERRNKTINIMCEQEQQEFTKDGMYFLRLL